MVDNEYSCKACIKYFQEYFKDSTTIELANTIFSGILNEQSELFTLKNLEVSA